MPADAIIVALLVIAAISSLAITLAWADYRTTKYLRTVRAEKSK